MRNVDFVFTGAGLSGLMTAWRIARHPQLKDKSIVLIDKDEKVSDDRTWCFWEEGDGEFDEAVSAIWNHADFLSDTVTRRMVLAPFAYKMIRSSQFYAMIRRDLQNSPNVTFVKEDVLGFSDAGDQVMVSTPGNTFAAKKVFNSILSLDNAYKQKDYPVLLQHFIGWKVKTAHPVFDPMAVTFMDFTVPQNGNTRFMYVLPFSPNEALIEYTLFSKDLLADEEYAQAMRDWLQKHNAGDFEILETEKGAIPMTVFPFEKSNTHNIVNIGSAGGWTKASTGFTFANTVRKSKTLVELVARGDSFKNIGNGNRFRLYDTLFLDVLAARNEKGSSVFSAMFKTNDSQTIFRFLDERSTLGQDLKIILSCPKPPFIRALLSRMLS